MAAEYSLKCHRRVFKETFKRIPRLAQSATKVPNPSKIKQYRQERRQPTQLNISALLNEVSSRQSFSYMVLSLPRLHAHGGVVHGGDGHDGGESCTAT